MLSSFIHSYGLRTSYVAVSLTWPSPPKLQIHRHLYVLDTYVPRPCKPLIFSLFNPEPIVFLTKPSTACFLPGEIPLSIKTKIWTRPYIIFLTPNIKHYQIIAIFVHICVCVCVCFLQTSTLYYPCDNLLTSSLSYLAGIYVLTTPVGWLAPWS